MVDVIRNKEVDVVRLIPNSTTLSPVNTDEFIRTTQTGAITITISNTNVFSSVEKWILNEGVGNVTLNFSAPVIIDGITGGSIVVSPGNFIRLKSIASNSWVSVVKGLKDSEFVKYGITDFNSINGTVFFQSVEAPVNGAVSGYGQGWQIEVARNGSQFMRQFVYFSDGAYSRIKSGGSWGSWIKFITGSSDGKSLTLIDSGDGTTRRITIVNGVITVSAPL